jgi:phosphoenolpyruvate synthase/pyruvate phosphate dikinase
VIPFGAFRRLLDQPLEPGGPSVFEWMKQQYRTLATLSDRPEAQAQASSRFLARLRTWIERADPGPEFREHLARTLAERFGADGSFGVFVRSDTNVEDLPGFTGAGLNLTISNVVGTAQVLDAIRRVWASPFTERAFGWRQAHMEQPEYVFPAVVVQRSFPSEKSGVMVTSDVDTGRMGWLTVAVSEGVGGAVAGGHRSRRTRRRPRAAALAGDRVEDRAAARGRRGEGAGERN